MLSSGHIIMPNATSIQCKDNGGTARDTLYVDGSNNTDIQAAASHGLIKIMDQDGATQIAAFYNNSGTKTLQLDDNGTLKDVLYVDAAHETKLQMANSSVKLYISNASGVNLFSIDSSGNVRAKGTVTASVTP